MGRGKVSKYQETLGHPVIQQLPQITTSRIPSAHNYCEYCQKPLGHVMELVDCSFRCCWHLISAKLKWLRGSKIRLKPFIIPRMEAVRASGMSYGHGVWPKDYFLKDACFTSFQNLCLTQVSPLKIHDCSIASSQFVRHWRMDNKVLCNFLIYLTDQNTNTEIMWRKFCH